MRHPEFQTTAPLDPDPQWPQGYIDVLRRAGAQEKNIPYCVSWVRGFFARYPNRPRRELGRCEIETFLSEIAQRQRVSNWMVQQARNAIETYYEKFRGIALTPRAGAEGLRPTGPLSSPEYETNSAQSASQVIKGGYWKQTPNVKPVTTPIVQPTFARAKQFGTTTPSFRSNQSTTPRMSEIITHTGSTSCKERMPCGDGCTEMETKLAVGKMGSWQD